MAKKEETSDYNRIKEVLEGRKKKGAESSRYWLSKESKVGYITLTNYFYGRAEPTLPTLYAIADVLDVHPKELLKNPPGKK